MTLNEMGMRMRRGILLLCGVAAIVVAGAAYARGSMAGRTGTSALPGRMAGCWALYDGAGRPASDSLYFAPARVRLRTERSDRPGGDFSAGPLWKIVRVDASGGDVPNPRDPRGVFENWWYGRDGKIHVNFSSGFSGTEFILPAAVQADTLHGSAVEHWDAGPPFHTDAGRVTAVRIACGGGQA